jgi:hypothetical protein
MIASKMILNYYGNVRMGGNRFWKNFVVIIAQTIFKE